MYQALYRKYRPVDFNSVLGQNSIVTTLRNSIIYNKINHAYMFFGPRGTGKTTTAKILARSINCLNPVDGSSCGKCENCLHSFEKECIDIIELDAASNNGVDEIREIINNISLVPTFLKYKVYIIDEVHMLSSGAFNALLKTLEEPPEHVVFILATTDPQKVPETIISRCQCFSFKRISDDLIVDNLKSIAHAEKIKIDDDVLEQIAISSNGGMRDSLVLLDQLSSFTDKKIDINIFSELNGSITYNDIEIFINNVFSGNIKAVLGMVSDYNSRGKNIVLIVNQIINYLRNIIVESFFSNNKKSYNIDLTIVFINYLNENLVSLKNSDNVKLYFECLIIKFIYDNKLLVTNDSDSLSENTNYNSYTKDCKEININNNDSNNDNEKKNIEVNNEDKSFPVDKKILNLDEVMKIRINNVFAKANKKEKESFIKEKEKFKDFVFDKKCGFISSLIVDSSVLVASNDSVLLGLKYDSSIEQLNLYFDKLSELFFKVLNRNVIVSYISESEWDNLAKEYVNNIKLGNKYNYIEEPELIFEEVKKNDIISSSAIGLFGEDIVEIY